jgi:hypothetical protein
VLETQLPFAYNTFCVDWWAKNTSPWFQEVAHIPMWVWDPRVGAELCGQRRQTLVQTIDLGVSLLDFFGALFEIFRLVRLCVYLSHPKEAPKHRGVLVGPGLPTTDTMMGRPIRLALENSAYELHEQGGLFGIFGAQVSIVDSEGKFIYMRGPKLANNSPLYQYTLMPTRMRGFMGQEEMESWEQHDGFNFTKGQKATCPLFLQP